jgi:hypothetical protein
VEGIGPVRAMRYENWVNGTYCTDNLHEAHTLPIANYGAPPAPVALLPDLGKSVTCQAVPEGPMTELMEHYVHLMGRFGAKLPNAVGILNIMDAQNTSESNQADLKRVDIQIIWNVPEVNERNELVMENGKVKLKEQGDLPIDEQGTKGTRALIQTSGKAIFLNRLSEYQGE